MVQTVDYNAQEEKIKKDTVDTVGTETFYPQKIRLRIRVKM